MIVALTTFDTLCGLRPLAETRDVLRRLDVDHEAWTQLCATLDRDDEVPTRGCGGACRGAFTGTKGRSWVDRPIGADGELDYGHIDVWLESDDRHTLEGDWGTVVVDRPTHAIEYLD